MALPPARCLISIVTHNHGRTIGACITSVLNQTDLAPGHFAVMITDNASTDGTPAAVETHGAGKVQLKLNQFNTGFCEAHNEAVSEALAAGAEYVLLLNPDVVLQSDALAKLMAVLDLDPLAGMACPKLLRADSALRPVDPPTLDAAGMFMTPQLRHFDRGSQEADSGQHDGSCYVFGASGAAVLMRARFIRDAALRNAEGSEYVELFDEEFFAYREDADLAWRAQWLGWRCRFVPEAVGFHERRVLPERRRHLPKELNLYSVRNRFLLQANNFHPLANLHCILPGLWRNVLVVAGVLALERSSLPALGQAWRLLPQALRKRRRLMVRRRVAHNYVGRWFATCPRTEPVLTPGASTLSSICAIVVNFNSGHRLTACVAELLRARDELSIQGVPLEIVVVDNASSDEGLREARSMFADSEGLRFLHSERNLGFAGAINEAARSTEADGLLVLNPDVLISGRAIVELTRAMARYPGLGAAAPILRSPDGAPQLGFTVRRFPTLGSTLAELFLLHKLWPRNPWTAMYLGSDDLILRAYLTGTELPTGPNADRNEPYLVEQPAGACLLIRREAYDAVNGFDERFYPAWFEDVDFCRRLCAAGYQAAVVAQASAVHEGGYSARALGSSAFAKIWYRNLLLYWQKHGSPGVAYIVLAMLPLALLLRSLGALLLGFKDNQATERQVARTTAVLARDYGATLIRSLVADLRDLGRAVRRIARGLATNHASPLLGPPQGDTSVAPSLREAAKDWRLHFASRLRGDGLELGALHRPLEKHDAMNVRYVDRLAVPELRLQYPELNQLPLVEPDILDDAAELSTVADESQDFVIAAHLIEHLRNPLEGLRNWWRVLRPGGLLYLIVPDKRFTFDRERVRTTLEHLILDYERPSLARDFEHFLDYARWVGKFSGEAALEEARSLAERDYSIHFHVFMPQDIEALVEWCSAHVAPYQLLEGPVKAPESDEFHLIVQKVG